MKPIVRFFVSWVWNYSILQLDGYLIELPFNICGVTQKFELAAEPYGKDT